MLISKSLGLTYVLHQSLDVQLPQQDVKKTMAVISTIKNKKKLSPASILPAFTMAYMPSTISSIAETTKQQQYLELSSSVLNIFVSLFS